MTGHLPHHRRGPRIDERRRDPNDWPTTAGIFVLAYVAAALCFLIFIASGVMR